MAQVAVGDAREGSLDAEFAERPRGRRVSYGGT